MSLPSTTLRSFGALWIAKFAASRVHVQPPVHHVELFTEAALRDGDADTNGEAAVIGDACGSGAGDHEKAESVPCLF